jgi:hypothetical protein
MAYLLRRDSCNSSKRWSRPSREKRCHHFQKHIHTHTHTHTQGSKSLPIPNPNTKETVNCPSTSSLSHVRAITRLELKSWRQNYLKSSLITQLISTIKPYFLRYIQELSLSVIIVGSECCFFKPKAWIVIYPFPWHTCHRWRRVWGWYISFSITIILDSDFITWNTFTYIYD